MITGLDGVFEKRGALQSYLPKETNQKFTLISGLRVMRIG